MTKHITKNTGAMENSIAEFWQWFAQEEQQFFTSIKNNKNIEGSFFKPLSHRLSVIKEGFYYLAGMHDEHTVELVFTADGDIPTIVFVEELVQAAPALSRWKFTAHKPPLDIDKLEIKMGSHVFNSENMFFFAGENPEYPDVIDITIVHKDLHSKNRNEISNGVYIFLDNYLGELEFLNHIDNLNIVGPTGATNDLVPIRKLRDFILWRQKEFVEKYEGLGYDSTDDEYSILEAELENGHFLLAVVNTDLLHWNRKASHPWIAILTIRYDGASNNGMPGKEDFELLQSIEDEILLQLKDISGYLNIGRQTADGEREIYFACKDFRMPSKIFYEVKLKYSSSFEMDYEIYKDKYWKSFERFMP